MQHKGTISGALLLLLALGLLILPLQWILAAVFAAGFHEFCHWLVIRFCGVKPVGLQAGLLGAQLEVRGLSRPQEFFCALSGPLGSLSLLLLSRWLPRTAVCGAFQGAYNLLPVFPLDGGRILRCFAKGVLPEHVAAGLCNVVQWLCLLAVCGVAAYATIGLRLGLLPVFAALCMLMRIFPGKIPCKLRGNSVQ